ncbi:MAG: hypothetical protein HUJ73_05505 [Eubacterium sp.]|nr:hypothetical protein [Eubacterium sp.]
MPSEREQVLPDPTVPEDFSLILVDDESVRVEICRIRTDSAGSYIWDMYCANKSEDSDYLFLAEDVSINGVMCDPSWGRRIQAGRDGRSAMQWTEGRLMTSQIKDVTEVTLTLKVTNETNPTLPPILWETFTIFPLGENAAVYEGYSPGESDIPVFQNDFCAMYITGLPERSAYGYSVHVCLINTSDSQIMFGIEDALINGKVCDPRWSVNVAGGKIARSEIIWFNGDLDASQADLSGLAGIDSEKNRENAESPGPAAQDEAAARSGNPEQTGLQDNTETPVTSVSFTVYAYNRQTLTEEYAREYVELNPSSVSPGIS